MVFKPNRTLFLSFIVKPIGKTCIFAHLIKPKRYVT